MTPESRCKRRGRSFCRRSQRSSTAQPLRDRDSGFKAFVGHWDGATGAAVPGNETLLHEGGDSTAILINQLQPRQRAHLGEIDSAETHPSDENIDAIAQRLVLE